MAQNLTTSLSSLLSRKFLVAMASMLLVTFGVDVDGPTKLWFITGIATAYGAFNIVQKRLEL